jgi:hypothetical protein
MSALRARKAAPSGRPPPSPAGSPRALNLPRAARVRTLDGTPSLVDGERIEAVRESWLVEDRWWTDRPLRRRYWEMVSVRGRNLIVFHDLCAGGWFTQGP